MGAWVLINGIWYEAMRRYEKIKEMEGVYTVSVCVPIASTDYDTVLEG